MAETQVGDMQIRLEELTPKIKIMAETVAAQLEQVTIENEEANKVRETVKKDEIEAEATANMASEIKRECDEQLAEAEPALKAALAALDTIQPMDITNIKRIGKPPPALKILLEGIALLKDVKPDMVPNPSGQGKIEDWEKPVQRMLAQANLLDSLKNYDKVY